MGVDIIASREGEHDYVRERIYQFMYWFIIKQGNDPKSVPSYFSGIVGSLVEWDRVGRSSATSLFKEIADSQAIQGTLKGYRRNYGKCNPAYKRQRIPFKAQWLTIADRSYTSTIKREMCRSR